MLVRKKMRRLHGFREHAVYIIQRNARGFLGRLEFLRVHKRKTDAVMTIRKMRNSWAIRNYVVKRKRDKTHLAVTLQRIGWGRLARK